MLKVQLSPQSHASLFPGEAVVWHLVFIIPTGANFNPVFKAEDSRLNICTSYIFFFPSILHFLLFIQEI